MAKFYVVNDANIVVSAHDTLRAAMISGNRVQAADPYGMSGVWSFVGRRSIAIGQRVAGRTGICYASAPNYPNASHKLQRDL